MILEELVHEIKNSPVLTAAQKNQCLELLPSLSKEQLIELASNVLWLHEQSAHMDQEEKDITTKLKLMFIQMNKYATRESKKARYESMEKKTRAKDESEVDTLIQEL